jgi:hypothetical protein
MGRLLQMEQNALGSGVEVPAAASAAAQPGEAPPFMHQPQNHGRELRRFPRWLAWLLVDGLF